MRQLAYRRVSTLEQSTERQLDGLAFNACYEDKATGGNTERPALQQMLQDAREGDTVHVHSIDRLARDTQDLLSLVKLFNSRGVAVKFHKEGLDFSAASSNPTSKLMFTMLSAFAEFERSMIRERQREGILKAKARGAYKGGKQRISRERVQQLLANGYSVTATARELSASRASVYRILRETAENSKLVCGTEQN